MNALELVAGAIVAAALDGRCVPRDVDGAPDATHDFDIELADATRIALEVTSSADEKVLSLLNAASRREWPGPGLADNWRIGVEHEAAPINMRRLTTGAVPALAPTP
jgi:hypothetical protein